MSPSPATPTTDSAASASHALLWPARRPVAALLIALLAVVTAMLSASRIQTVGSLEPMFDPHDPRAAALLRVVGDFSAAESLVLLVSLPDAPGDPRGTPVEQQRMARYAQRLQSTIEADATTAAMVRSYVYRPGEHMKPFIERVVAPGGVYYLSDEQFAEFQRRLEPDAIAAQVQRNERLMASASPAADGVARRVLDDPLRLSELLFDAMRSRSMGGGASAAMFEADEPMFSVNRRHLLISIMGVEPPSDLDFSKAFVPSINAAVNEADPGELIVRMTGGYAFAEHSERVIRSDMIRSTFWAVVMLQVLFLIAYRHVASFPLSFVPIATGIVVGFGLFAFYAARLTPVVAASGAILAGLGVDYCIHYLSHYHTARAQGLDALSASRHTLGTLGAMSAACVTSLLGFAAIAVSGVPALRDFAVVSTLGLGCIFVATWWVLPACLRLVDRKAGPDVAPIRFDAAPLMTLVSRYRVASMSLCVVLTAAAIVVLLTMGLVRVSPDLSSLSPQPNPPMQAQQRIAQLFPSSDEPTPVYLEADSPEALWRLANDVDARLRTVANELKANQSPAMLEVFSIASLLPDPDTVAARQLTLRAVDAARVEADFRSAIDDSIFNMAAYEGYATFLRDTLRGDASPPGYASLVAHPRVGEMLLPLRAFEADAASQRYAAVTLLQVQGVTGDRAARQQVWERIDASLADLPRATLTGMELVASNVQATIRRDMEKLALIAGIAVMVWLFIVFRRLDRVLLTLIPGCFGMLLVLAVMRLLDQELNVINLIALPMLAGVGVDDGIFLVSIATRRHRDDDTSPAEHRANLLRDLGTSTHAITMTSLTTALGFGSLMLTNTPAIQSLGLVLAVGMVGCWLGSVGLLALILLSRHLPPRGVQA